MCVNYYSVAHPHNDNNNDNNNNNMYSLHTHALKCRTLPCPSQVSVAENKSKENIWIHESARIYPLYCCYLSLCVYHNSILTQYAYVYNIIYEWVYIVVNRPRWYYNVRLDRASTSIEWVISDFPSRSNSTIITIRMWYGITLYTCTRRTGRQRNNAAADKDR